MIESRFKFRVEDKESEHFLRAPSLSPVPYPL
jgi:hypothetical protein